MKVEVNLNKIFMTDLEYGDPFYFDGELHIRTMKTNAVRVHDGRERIDLDPSSTRIRRAKVKVVADVS